MHSFWLSDKVVALHFHNSTAKGSLYNQEDAASNFLSRISCCILNLADMHGINLLPTYLLTYLNVEADYPSQGRLVS